MNKGLVFTSMIRKAVILLLAILLSASLITSLFFYTENLKLKDQVYSFNQEINILKSANLTTALGIVEIPPHYYSSEIWWVSNFSYIWVTGWVFNSGAGIGENAGLEVLAFDKENSVLMNYTVPIVSDGVFSINENKTLIPYYQHLTPLEFGNVLGQQNATVRLSIFHEGSFPNSTRYEINPVWENNQ